VETGLGPFTDGMARLALTPEDVLVVVAIALLAGLGGPAIARRSVLFLPPAWLAGGFLGAAFPAGGELAWARTISFSLAGVLVALARRCSSSPRLRPPWSSA
jgi:hypothetical protein